MEIHQLLVSPGMLIRKSRASFENQRQLIKLTGRRRIVVRKRNTSVAVIGAGDYIGAAIAKRFAAEGFTIFAGRRNGDKLTPLVQEIEALAAGGRLPDRWTPAGKIKSIPFCGMRSEKRR